MDEFTKVEIERINYLYGNDFKGELTAIDVKLIARFEYARAKEDIESDINRKEHKEDIENNLEAMRSIKEQAIANLESIQKYALSRLESLEKRERPTIEDAQKNELKIDNAPAVLHHGI